jgi:hypothetical protein
VLRAFQTVARLFAAHARADSTRARPGHCLVPGLR